MNVQPGKEVAVRPLQLPARRTRQDREFLPAALEILDTPASPVNQTFLWLICLMFAAVLAWSWFAKLDINAVAPGRIQMSGRSKVVQPLEAGKVKAIYVQNGTQVKEGDLLIELESTETQAELDAQTKLVEALDGEIARRRHTIAVELGEIQDTAVPFPANVSDLVRIREINAMKADLAQFTTTRDELLAQIAEKEATKQRLTMSIAARQSLIESLKERADMRAVLVAKSSGSRGDQLNALEALQTEETNLANDSGQLIETDAAVITLRRKIDEKSATSVAEQSDKMNEAQQKRDRAAANLVKAVVKVTHTRLTAPIEGTLQQLAVTSIGQVVTSGQALMVIVPKEGPLEIEAMVSSSDIGFVEPAQETVLKIDSFPFTRYGVVHGKVLRVSRDAVSEKDAEAASDSISVGQGQSLPPVTGTQKTKNLVFPVTISLNQNTFLADGKEVPLIAGMTVSAEIRTGERRAIDYLLSPLRETTSQAGRER